MTNQHISELRRLYKKADTHAREVGELRREVLIPAINELRYAGHHLLDSIDDCGVIDPSSIRKAKSHCERAMYEAAEAGIMFCLDSIEDFRKDYKDVVISEVIHDHPHRLVRVQQVSDMVVKGRSDRDSVESHVDEYMKGFGEVRDIVQLFEASRDDLNVKRNRQNQAYRQFIIRCLLILLGILLTILGLVGFTLT